MVSKAEPFCSHCNSFMEPKYFVGYYERFFFWKCKCEVLLGSTVEAGSYTDAVDGEPTEEYLGIQI